MDHRSGWPGQCRQAHRRGVGCGRGPLRQQDGVEHLRVDSGVVRSPGALRRSRGARLPCLHRAVLESRGRVFESSRTRRKRPPGDRGPGTGHDDPHRERGRPGLRKVRRKVLVGGGGTCSCALVSRCGRRRVRGVCAHHQPFGGAPRGHDQGVRRRQRGAWSRRHGGPEPTWRRTSIPPTWSRAIPARD